jgi:UPF0176 protein
MTEVVVAALYHFVCLDNYHELQKPLQKRCAELGIQGTLLLAEEGINGTIAGSRRAIDKILEFIHSDPRLVDLRHKESFSSFQPFYRMKVRLKNEIVTLGVDGIDPTEKVGVYVDAQDWNELISDPDTIVIDTRNDYEFAMGTFKRAIDPKTRTFRDFPQWVSQNEQLQSNKDKKVAMFCTGGIRCEKATSYLLQQGFEQVFHLKDGVLKYLEMIGEDESLWEGECFVFDQRVSVGHQLKVGEEKICFACSFPVSIIEMKNHPYEEGVYCPNCVGRWDDEQLLRFRERQKQINLANQREKPHLGQNISVQRNQKLHSLSISHSKPILYSFRRCPYAIRARMVLAVAGIQVEHREVLLRDKPTHMLKISPKGTVPILLLPDGDVYDESLDIMKWALDKNNPMSWSVSENMDLITQADEEFKKNLDLYKYSSKHENVDPIYHRNLATDFLLELEKRLAGNIFLSGDELGFVDIAIFPLVRQFNMVDNSYLASQPLPKVLGWLERILENTFFTNSMTKYQQWKLGDEPIFTDNNQN